MTVPKLVRVTELAREHDPPLSSEAMLRRLKKLQETTKRQILFKPGGKYKGAPWLADKSYLAQLAGDGGKNLWKRLRDLEAEVAALTVDVGECRRIMAENGMV